MYLGESHKATTAHTMAGITGLGAGRFRGKRRFHIKSIELVDNYRKVNLILYYLFENIFIPKRSIRNDISKFSTSGGSSSSFSSCQTVNNIPGLGIERLGIFLKQEIGLGF